MDIEIKVTLKFSEPVKNIGHIVDSVLLGLIDQANGRGIVHEDEEGHTAQVTVSTIDGQFKAQSSYSQGYLLEPVELNVWKVGIKRD